MTYNCKYIKVTEEIVSRMLIGMKLLNKKAMQSKLNQVVRGSFNPSILFSKSRGSNQCFPLAGVRFRPRFLDF